jgi:NAD(P)-dependent dehydrogenase (short-subunit alcohol dehydrogenase family)
MTKLAIITGANGDMGREITKAVAQAGYTTIMACRPSEKAHLVYTNIMKQTNGEIVLFPIDLASTESILNFVEIMNKNYSKIDLLINNAGVLYPNQKDLEGKWDHTTMVNYFGPYLLTNKLLPLLSVGARIVNVVSLTYRYGKIEHDFFEGGRHSWVQQVRNYSNSKLALLYFSLDLAKQLKERNISVNCSDPGIVGTKIIAMNNHFFDKVCDVIARPFMKSPKGGAKTAIYLALSEEAGKISGGYYKNTKQIPILRRVFQNDDQETLRLLTKDLLLQKNISL